MTEPVAWDLALYRGDTFSQPFRFWTDTARTVARDLTGVTSTAQIRESTDSVDAVNLTCALTLPNTVTVTLPAAAWPTFTLAKGVWDLQFTLPSGAVETVVAGKVKVTADVTKVGP